MKIDLTFDETAFLNYFGLDRNPFPVAPDDDHFYFSDRIEQVVTEITHGVVARKGFMVLTGEVGLGKTTISRRIVNLLKKNKIITSMVLHTSYQDAELLMEINRNFGNGINIPRIGNQLRRLNNFLLAQSHQNKNCVILIDDAQNLNFKSFELIRMISNLEANQQKLVQIILVGQPELKGLLNSHRLRQLKSRVVIQKEVLPLNPEELKSYLNFKLNASGNNGRTLITAKAHRQIYEFTRGNLRQINVLMDRCLYVALLNNTTRIHDKIITEAHQDLFPHRRKPFSLDKRLPALLSGLLATVVSGILLCHGLAGRADHAQKIQFQPIQTGTEANNPAEYSTAIPAHMPPPNESQNPTGTRQPPDTGVPASVSRFLEEYNLSKFEAHVWEALKSGTTESLNKTLFEKTGCCIIQLPRLPDRIKRDYGTLSYTSDRDNNKSFFLFWRPEFKIKEFYYGYRGIEIIQLQKRLARMGLYNAKIDDIVGRHLMKSVISFQRITGLPVTGYPGEKTVFMLCHQKKPTLKRVWPSEDHQSPKKVPTP